MDNYFFVCPKHKIVLDSDEKIEKHQECYQGENSCKYWNEDYLFSNPDLLKELIHIHHPFGFFIAKKKLR